VDRVNVDNVGIAYRLVFKPDAAIGEFLNLQVWNLGFHACLNAFPKQQEMAYLDGHRETV
jgi:hypothetical protein